MDFLNDIIFLDKIDKLKVRETSLRLVLLDFNENPIREIQGKITGNGNLSINGAAGVRRTISFQMLASAETNNITNLENLISLNKKCQIYMGVKNPLREYQKYGSIVWFPLGMFVISTATISCNATSCNISIQAKDKMCLLDGSVGGTFPTTIAFHEIYEEDEMGNVTITNPTIYQIIIEALTHYGGETTDNIIIKDLEETAKKLVKYCNPNQPLWVSKNEINSDVKVQITSESPGPEYIKFIYGEDVGYTQTEMTYPGELILSAGESVVALLNKIIGVLGDFEFFYNIEGKFIFQRKPNYLNTSYNPLEENNGKVYIKKFSNSKYIYSFLDSETVVSVNNNPKYDNIKNDFIVWGQRPIANGSINQPICYRIAIDTKPELDRCLKNMYGIYSHESDKIAKNLIRYEFIEDLTKTPVLNKEAGELSFDLLAIGLKPAYADWREELYRRALEASLQGKMNSPYDTELLAFWRENFTPIPKERSEYENQLIEPINIPYFDEESKDSQGIKHPYWNPQIWDDPSQINYWLDFIDTSSEMGKYSVNNIGHRAKVINSNDIKSIYNKEIFDIIFVDNPTDFNQRLELTKQFKLDSQRYCFLTTTEMDYLITSATGASAFDQIRKLLYKHLIYNTQITLTSIPKYYLEPNCLIYVQNQKSGVSGEFVINSMTIPLSHSGTMNITASQALIRI